MKLMARMGRFLNRAIREIRVSENRTAENDRGLRRLTRIGVSENPRYPRNPRSFFPDDFPSIRAEHVPEVGTRMIFNRG
jgi:hypothetical protein